MATYYNNPNQREAAPMLYLRESLPGSYPETPALSGNMMMYMNSGSFSDALGGSSQPHSNCINMSSVGGMDSTHQQQEVLSGLDGTRLEEHDFNVWRDGRNEMLVMHQHQLSSPTHSIISNGQNLHNQGLSLSLGSQIASGVQMPSSPYRNSNMGLVSFLSPHPSMSGEQGGRNASLRDDQPRNIDCVQPGFPGGNHEMSRGDPSYGLSIVARIVPNSRYLKAAQQLLDEIVNVRKALKHPNDTKNQSAHDNQKKGAEDTDANTKNDASAKHEDSASNPSSELSQAEKQELQNKLTKLVSMLEEVDKRYRHYCSQMHVVVSSFDAIAGCGAAKPYTALALQRISRQFRCLRDCINGQIQQARKSLGEQDTYGNSGSVGIARLRYVDQQLRQQRALQQLGMMQQHAWRPQRGLPENSVSILRAWLFEHFLHPYPKDSDKIMLARQTGLSRNQVSNWFINARVRLWKPMVEEMYKEELGDMELDSNSSSENAVKASKGDVGSSEDKGESLQHSTSSIANEKASSGKFIDTKPERICEIEIGGSNGGGSFDNGTHEEVDRDYCEKPREEQRTNVYESSFFPDAMVQPDAGGSRFITEAAAAYHMSELERYGGGSDVSLTLGLQHCEEGTLPLSGGMPHGFVTIRGDNFFGATSSSIGPETTGYESINPGDPQHRLSSSHLLRDFVA